MIVLNNVACTDDYSTSPATISWVYASSGGYAAVRDNDVWASLGWGALGDEQWTDDFHMAPGNLALSPFTTGVRFKNYTAGQVAHVTAVLSDADEPPVFLTAAGVSGGGSSGIAWSKVGVNCLQGGGIAWSKVGANCV